MKQAEETRVVDAIEKTRVVHPRSGYRMLLRHLNRDHGIKIGETRLRRIMEEKSLWARIKRGYKVTTNSNHSHRVYPNLLRPTEGVIEVNRVDQVWVADFTYIRVETGFVYLAAIMDLYSRKIVGWAISNRIDRALALSALRMAITKRNPQPGIIHHSDRGVQYLCDDYIAELKRHGFAVSNSRRGNPYDNAFMESFMKTLKHNEVDLCGTYESIIDVNDSVPHFIEEVYNRKRLHSSLGYKSPEQFETEVKTDKELQNRYALSLGK